MDLSTGSDGVGGGGRPQGDGGAPAPGTRHRAVLLRQRPAPTVRLAAPVYRHPAARGSSHRGGPGQPRLPRESFPPSPPHTHTLQRNILHTRSQPDPAGDGWGRAQRKERRKERGEERERLRASPSLAPFLTRTLRPRTAAAAGGTPPPLACASSCTHPRSPFPPPRSTAENKRSNRILACNGPREREEKKRARGAGERDTPKNTLRTKPCNNKPRKPVQQGSKNTPPFPVLVRRRREQREGEGRKSRK